MPFANSYVVVYINMFLRQPAEYTGYVFFFGIFPHLARFYAIIRYIRIKFTIKNE